MCPLGENLSSNASLLSSKRLLQPVIKKSSDLEVIRMAMLPEIKLTPSEPSMGSNLGSASLLKRSRVSPDKLLKLIFISRVVSYDTYINSTELCNERSLSKSLSGEIEYCPSLVEANDLCYPKRTHENLAPWRVKRAKELMITLMTQGCSIGRLASECASSRSHFSRGFKNATGMAPHDWLRREKLNRAEELLRSRRIPIGRVAQECGFSDQSYFTRVFRQLKGVSPRQWQALNCPQVSDEARMGLGSQLDACTAHQG